MSISAATPAFPPPPKKKKSQSLFETFQRNDGVERRTACPSVSTTGAPVLAEPWINCSRSAGERAAWMAEAGFSHLGLDSGAAWVGGGDRAGGRVGCQGEMMRAGGNFIVGGIAITRVERQSVCVRAEVEEVMARWWRSYQRVGYKEWFYTASVYGTEILLPVKSSRDVAGSRS